MSSWNQPVAPCYIATLLQNHLKRCGWGLFLISVVSLCCNSAHVSTLADSIWQNSRRSSWLNLLPIAGVTILYFQSFINPSTPAQPLQVYNLSSPPHEEILLELVQNHHTWFSLVEQTLDKWKIYSTAAFQQIPKTHLQYLFTTNLTQSILFFV